MAKRLKIMHGREIFYTKLSVFLHIYTHNSTKRLPEIFGVSESTMRGWVKEYNESRLESILKNFKVGALPDYELPPGEGDSTNIRKILLRQARAGSTTAAKILLDIQEKEEEILLEVKRRVLFGNNPAQKEQAFRLLTTSGKNTA
jgi:hypothetical protein